MSDDELLELARKCLAGDSPEAIGRALVEFRAVLGPEETIALIERHSAEVADLEGKLRAARDMAEINRQTCNAAESALADAQKRVGELEAQLDDCERRYKEADEEARSMRREFGRG